MYAHSGGRSRAPLTHTAGVDVEEAGLRVEADAAGLQRDGRLVQRLKVALGQADVGRLALHMQRALGDAIAVGGKIGVGLGRARSEEHTSALPSLMRISLAVFCLI